MNDMNFQSLDPDKRDWEYDGSGERVYKGTRTPYNDEYEKWKSRFGYDWEEETEEEISKKNERRKIGQEDPYYVDLPQEES